LVTGNGTGTEAIAITLPNGTGMNMEVSLGCETASISIVDDQFVPVVEFKNVPVIGKMANCEKFVAKGFDKSFKKNPGADFRTK
jgi:hypothetical protein